MTGLRAAGVYPLAVALAVLAAVAAGFGPTAAVAEEQDPVDGSWVGRLETSGEATELRVELGRSDSGEWQGTLWMPDRSPQPVPLRGLSVSEEGIRFSAPHVPGAPSFEGRIVAKGSRIEGSATVDAPPPPPGTDVYLFRVAVDGDSWSVGEPINVSDRDGYDNQPRFLPDGSGLLYTSIRDDQADIYRYEIDGGRSVRVTATDQSEYSPTPLPSGNGFSTVRVEDDGTQRLWSFDLDGGGPALLLPDLEPVGYHGWLDAERLALFVLGDPPTLVLATRGQRSTRTVAENIGRSIHATPDGKAVSFVHKAGDDDWRIELLDLESGRRRTLLGTRSGGEDFIWTPDGRLLMGEGSGLFVADPGEATPSWQPVADLSGFGVSGITRLAMGSDSKLLAVVGERPDPDTAPDRQSFAFSLLRVEE